MKAMRFGGLIQAVVAAILLMASSGAQACFFPEFPFCPLGGPPGWANRIMHDDYYRHRNRQYPPVYYSRYAPPAYPAAGYPMPRQNSCGSSGNDTCPWRRH